MAMNTATYMQMGSEAAKRGERLTDCPLSSRGWQREAWEAGFNEATKPAPKKLPNLLEQRHRAAYSHWPQAAAEHGKLLALGMAASNDDRRTKRLLRSFNRLVKRYGPAQQPTTN